jgi:hypothetical protein
MEGRMEIEGGAAANYEGLWKRTPFLWSGTNTTRSRSQDRRRPRVIGSQVCSVNGRCRGDKFSSAGFGRTPFRRTGDIVLCT